MTKSDLRQQFLSRRRALTMAEIARRSALIADRVLSFTPVRTYLSTDRAGVIHVFLPIVRQNEVDTWPIIRQIWHNHPSVQIATSVADTATNQLAHYILTPDTPLTDNQWGIPEPQPRSTTAVASSQIDVVFVPLLAFDKQGHRVGYGKGYYDRFLNECRPDCPTIGLSLFEPVEQISDIYSTDIALQACVTPEKAYLFGER